MISSDKSPQQGTGLLKRIQRYARASAIFRRTEAPANAPISPTRPAVKASILPGPSTLPVGRTVQRVENTPSITPETFPTTVQSLGESPQSPAAAGSVAAAIEHAERMQRTPAPPVSTPQQTQTPPDISRQVSQTPPPAAIEPSPTAASEPEPATQAPETDNFSESDWGRLQRIFHGHQEKDTPESSPASAPPPETTVQRQESSETAVSPPETPPSSQDSIQRAIHAAESSQTTPPPSRKSPLEAVWPVQREEPEQKPASDEPVIMRQPDTPVSKEPVQSKEEIDRIKNTLDVVSSDKRTDSSIELHLPRRPRPASAVQKKPVSQEEANKAFWDRVNKSNQPKTESKTESVQRTVETEIGPLPADMWELLGQTPPDTAQSGSGQTPDVQAKASEQSAPPSAEGDSDSFFDEAASVAPSSPDAIQRAIAAAEAPEPTQPTPLIPSSEDAPSRPSPATSPTVQRAVPETRESDSPAPTTPEITPQSGDASKSAVQRAIAAAESPPKPEAPQTPPETPSTTTAPQVQRKETSPTPGTGFPTILPEPKPTTDPASDAIQRTADPTTSDVPASTSVDLNAETAPLPPLPEQPINKTDEDAVQRAIAAAEAPTQKGQPKTEQPASTIDTPESHAESIQRRVDVSDTTPISESPQIPQSDQPVATADHADTGTPTSTGPETAVSPPHPATSDSIQRAIAAAESPAQPPVETPPSTPDSLQREPIQEVGSSPSANIENVLPSTPAEPLTPGVSDTQPTTTPDTPTTQDAIQRAIASAEKPAEISKPQKPSTTQPPAVPSSQTIQRSETTPEQPTTTPSADTQKTASDSLPSESDTPVSDNLSAAQSVASPPTSASSDAIQRAIAAAEMPSQPSAQTDADPTDDSATQTAVPPTADAVQRKPSQAPEAKPPTPEPQKTTPDAIQRAIAAAEKPAQPGSKSLDSPITPSRAGQAGEPPAPSRSSQDAIQRAIAAAESPSAPAATTPSSQPSAPSAPSGQKPTETPPVPSSPGTSARQQARIQRAIAAAEKPSSQTRSEITVQRASFPTETAVTPTETLTPEATPEGWQISQETAVTPETTTTTTATASLMRAIGEAERSTSTETPASEPYQWPDIMPTKSNDSVQRWETASPRGPGVNIGGHRAASAAEQSESEPEETKPPEIDMDKLAKQVYSQLRKRLAIEWERGRGKR